jgi:hypothetical protein
MITALDLRAAALVSTQALCTAGATIRAPLLSAISGASELAHGLPSGEDVLAAVLG